MRCGPADETHRAARTHPRTVTTTTRHLSSTRQIHRTGISWRIRWPRVSPRSRPGPGTRTTPRGRNARALGSRLVGPDRPLRALKLTDIIDRLGLHDQETGTPRGPSCLAILQPARGRERQRLEDPSPPRHQPAGLFHPAAPLPREHRQRWPSCPSDPADSHPIKRTSDSRGHHDP
jgi:hypothetical protein